jgi:hypothetical protein
MKAYPVLQKEGRVMSTGKEDTAVRYKPHPDRSPPSHTKAKLPFLGIDRIVEHLSAIFTRAGARKIEATVPDRMVRLAVDQEQMDRAFVTLGTTVAQGAAVTILGGLVPIKAGEENEGKGCALLSISVRDEQPTESDPSGDSLAAAKGIIKKYGGSFRFWRQHGEMRFSLYLPVLHGA